MRSIRSLLMVGVVGLFCGSAGAVDVPWDGDNGWKQWHPHRDVKAISVVGTQTYFGSGKDVEVDAAPVVADVMPAVAVAPEPVKVQCPGSPPPKGVKLDAEGCWVIDPVHFDFNKAQIRKLDKANLDGVAKALLENPHIVLDVNGHTDARGSDKYNQGLSERRARAVTDYLVKKGVDRGRLLNTGYGEKKPVDDNKSKKGRANNRRVELAPKRR
ncbi:MAG: OmpA family protein [Magnetococcales bacterium]|nr:OmpA family protein [Magnetococcales bacterium]